MRTRIYVEAECKRHGRTQHSVYGLRVRCLQCEAERKKRYRLKAKETLASEHGGKCQSCGYDKYLGALEFHHVDPTTKEFGLGGTGWMDGMDKLRKEAAKCVLVCSNCHKEIEAGITQCPVLMVDGETLNLVV